MTYLMRSGALWRVVRDAAAAFTLFLVIMALTAPSHCHNCQPRLGDFLSLSAQAGELTKDVVSDLPGTAASMALVATPAQSSSKEPVFRTTDHKQAVYLLAAVLSLLAAFNLALFRHLRRVNASPRPGRWRRD